MVDNGGSREGHCDWVRWGDVASGNCELGHMNRYNVY